MKFPFLATLILFVLWLNHTIRRLEKKDHKLKESYWDKETEANSVRRKSLSDLDYISIPYDLLPFDALPGNPVCKECEDQIRELADSKIVNLTGISNTDLKLRYGAANITALSEYDQNYTSLVCALQKWGKVLYDAALFQDAANVLSFSVSTGTDIEATYRLLCDIYLNKSDLSEKDYSEKISHLLNVANSLHSLSRVPITAFLQSLSCEDGQISRK